MEQLTLQIDNINDVMQGIDAAQRKACTAFIEIGYILRKADDAQIYKQKGYSSIFSFAEKEYGWDQSQTSRFMNINREYSVDGYSCVLQEKYEGFGQAKLVEMLKLPDNLREEITPDMKRDDIRQIKKEFDAAEDVRQQEQFENAFAPAQEKTLLQKAVKALFNMDIYARRIPKLWSYMLAHDNGEPVNEQDVLMAMMPNGYGHTRAGSLYCFFRKEEISVVCGREKETHTYTEFIHAIVHISNIVELDTPENWYLMVFGNELPKEKENVADKNAKNNESPLGNPVSGKNQKTAKNDLEINKKEAKRCDSSTGGIQKEEVSEEKTPEAAVKSEENNESPLGNQPLDGQTEISDFAEKMPITYEKSSEDKKRETDSLTESSSEAAVKSGENDESPLGNLVSEVVPDMVDGVCQFCAGNKNIESNDGQFSIKLTPRGIGRIERARGIGGYAVVEFAFCPKCGKKLG